MEDKENKGRENKDEDNLDEDNNNEEWCRQLYFDLLWSQFYVCLWNSYYILCYCKDLKFSNLLHNTF